MSACGGAQKRSGHGKHILVSKQHRMISAPRLQDVPCDGRCPTSQPHTSTPHLRPTPPPHTYLHELPHDGVDDVATPLYRRRVPHGRALYRMPRQLLCEVQYTTQVPAHAVNGGGWRIFSFFLSFSLSEEGVSGQVELRPIFFLYTCTG